MEMPQTKSREYLEELWAEAKQHLPGWLYASLMNNARARAGGRSSHRTFAPSTVEKIALARISRESYKGMDDADLNDVWKHLSRWYGTAKKKRESVESIVNAALITRKEMISRKLSVSSSALVEATGEFDSLMKSDEDLVRGVPDVPESGPLFAPVAFIEASLDPIAKARGEQLVGDVGAAFSTHYLKPLGLSRDDVLLMALVPQVLKGLDGLRREPRPAEVELWKDVQGDVLNAASPTVVVALGRTVGRELGDRADFVLPHPSVVARFGDRGEVSRKIKHIGRLVEQKQRVFKALSTKLVKSEGETRSEKAEQAWADGWFERLSRTGGGRFSYQHHWRGLGEDEIGMSDEQLMLKTDHSVHGDLRFETDDGSWGFAVFLGKTKTNRDLEHNDRLIDWDLKKRLEVAPKLRSSKEWLDVGKEKPFVCGSGEAGSPESTHAKFFLNDSGTFQLGVVKKDAVEIFLDGEELSGRYLISLAPPGDGRRWLIDRPKSQTPIAKSSNLADVLSEQKAKNHKFLVWSEPGQRPRFIDVATEQVEKDREPVPVAKADPVKCIVYGVVLDPYGKDGPEADAHGDWPTPSMVEEAAHEFAVGPCVIGLQHGKKANAQLVETSVEQYPSRKDYLAAMSGQPHRVYRRKFGDDVLHSGSWVVGVRLGPKEWQMYEDGELTAFSPGGFGIKTPVTPAEMPEVEFIDLEERRPR